MAYYITNKITNKINPNLITGEVALFDTEQDYKNAKQKWITDNTVINEFPAFDKNGKFLDGEEKYKYTLTPELKTLPLEYETIDNIQTIKPAPQGYEINKQQSGYIELPNPTKTKYIQITTPNESDYQYRPADHNEIRQYASDYLDFKKINETRTDIILSFKTNPTIENTQEFDIEDYLNGQIQEEVFGLEYMYVEPSNEVLNEFLANKQAVIDNDKVKQIQNLHNINVAKIISIQNTILSDFTGIFNGIILNKLSVDRLIELCTLIDNTENKDSIDKIFSLNCALYFEVNKKDIVGKYLKIISTIKKNVHDNAAVAIAKSLTLASNQDEAGLEAYFDTITPELLDGDNVKDGKISIVINDDKIKVFNSTTLEEITQDTSEIQRLINLAI